MTCSGAVASNRDLSVTGQNKNTKMAGFRANISTDVLEFSFRNFLKKITCLKHNIYLFQAFI